MNRSVIIYILGWVLKLEGAFMALPCITALCYWESSGWAFFVVMLGCLALGQLVTFRKPRNTVFFMKEGCIATALSWIVLSLAGCLPFVISGAIPSFTDALFETISGFTTTGTSILSDVEALPYCMLFWRSFTHWLGGMGVLVFLLAVIQMTGGSHMNLMRAESPGPSVGKFGPKVMYTARVLYLIYIGMTVLQIILMLCGGASLFDSLTLTFGSAGTGGFGIKNDSMAGYSPYLQWVVTIFMTAFGINFNFYFLLLLRKWKQAVCMEEVWGYLGVIGASIALITWNIYNTSVGFFENLRTAAFQVSSVITTTGYSTVDFDQCSTLSRTILVVLMFVGACAGSTGGGIKISRILILVKALFRELRSYIYPKSVSKIKMEGKSLDDATIRGSMMYMIAYFLLFGLSMLLISFEGHDLITTFTSVTTTFNNIGPGLGLVRPSCNFGFFSDFSKYVFMFNMLFGRLELFPLLILMYPPTWRGLLKRKKPLKLN